jgi:glycosyltransferase involved in cell wall biosynthesis
MLLKYKTKIINFLRRHTRWGKQGLRFIDYVFTKNINHLLLKFKPLPKYEYDDVTVIAAIRDIPDHRIINAFDSIRSQDYPKQLIKIIFVDYSSMKKLIPKYKSLCENYDTEYIRLENKPIWNKSHALNIAIKKANSKYILSTDADIMFEKNYIKEAVKELQRDPYQYILARCLDAPEDAMNETDYFKLKVISTYRSDTINRGINMTLTHFYHKINGYDEGYTGWGAEDDDMIKRFRLLGLKKRDITHISSYIHQWHPKSWGSINDEQRKKNEDYFMNNHTIVRNKDGWGEINQ